MLYERAQWSALGAVAAVAVLLGAGVAVALAGDTKLIGSLAVAFIAGTAFIVLLFSRLTVTVDEGRVAAAFGRGWPKRRIELRDITAIRQVRNKWWYGWGIRKVSQGWMFNVWGLDAVELELNTGRRFRIGTDDPAGLLEALAQQTSLRPPGG